MQTRTRNALALAALAAVLLGALVWVAQHRKIALPPSRAIDAIPEGAMLVASADMRALRAAPAFAPFLREGREIAGVGKVRDVCGFDPIEAASEIVVAIPAAGQSGDFGLAASGITDEGALIACASKVIEARGGRPVVTTIGGFRSVRDASLDSGGSGGEIAMRAGGPLLFGAGTYLRSMIDAADGRIPSVLASQAHAARLRELGDATIAVSVVLTPQQRRALSDELAASGEVGAPIASVNAGALGVRIGPTVDLYGVLTCDDAGACGRLATSLRARRDDAASSAALGLLGVGPLLEGLSIEPKDSAIHARVSVPVELATALVERLVALRGAGRAAPGEAPARERDDASPAPERLDQRLDPRLERREPPPADETIAPDAGRGSARDAKRQEGAPDAGSGGKKRP